MNFLSNNLFLFDAVEWVVDGLTTVLECIMLWICGFVYGAASALYDIFFEFASLDVLKNFSGFGSIIQRIQVLLGLIMLFKLAFTFLQDVISPDNLTGKSDKSAFNVIKDVIIVVAMLVSVNFIFYMVETTQSAIVNGNVLGRLIMGADTSLDPDESGVSYGDQMAYMTWMQFFIADNNTSCLNNSNNEGCQAADSYVQKKVLGLSGSGSDLTATAKSEDIEVNGILAAIAGLLLCWMLLGYVIDVGVRAFKLAFLQMIAPICIIGHIGKSKKDDPMMNWLKELGKAFADLFLKIAILMLAVILVSQVETVLNTVLSDDITGLKRAVAYLLLLVAIFGFARMIPSLIASLFGVKIESSTNPFTRAGFGAMVGSIFGGTIGSVQGAAAGFATGGVLGGLRGLVGGAARGTYQGIRTGYSTQKLDDVRKNFGKINTDTRDSIQNAANRPSLRNRVASRVDDVRNYANNARITQQNTRTAPLRNSLGNINQAATRGNIAEMNIMNRRLKGNTNNQRFNNRNEYVNFATDDARNALNQANERRNQYTDVQWQGAERDYQNMVIQGASNAEIANTSEILRDYMRYQEADANYQQAQVNARNEYDNTLTEVRNRTNIEDNERADFGAMDIANETIAEEQERIQRQRDRMDDANIQTEIDGVLNTINNNNSSFNDIATSANHASSNIEVTDPNAYYDSLGGDGN